MTSLRAAIALILLAFAVFPPAASLAQNFGNIPPQTVLGNPDPTQKLPARPMPTTAISLTAYGAIPNNPAVDNLAAINNALVNAKAPVIIEAGNVYYSSGQILVPDKASLILNGTIKRIPSYTATDCRAFVTQASTLGSSIIGSGTIDLNAPASGNWLAGLAPTGNTVNVVDRDFTITGATCGGLDWNFANQGLIHTNDAFDNIKIVNSGGRGAYFAGMHGGHAANLTVVSTGNDAISITNTQDWALVTPYVNKATPPPVIYNNAAETGMCIFRAPTIDRITITSPICDDNLHAASDGIGIGENGIVSSTSQTIGTTGSMTFTLPAGGVFAPGFPVTIISSASVVANQMYGTVTSFSGTTLTVNITSSKGSGTHADWIINTEEGTVVLTNPIVRNAGLFGIDCASNFTVTGGEIDNAKDRGINIGRDLGGRVSNCHFSGTTIKNTGPPASGSAVGIMWGSTLGNATSMENISLTGVQVIDDRSNPGTYIGQNVNMGNGTQFANISYDMASVPAQPFGYLKSYNVFGSNPDPHLDGSCFPYTPTLTWTGGPPAGPTSSGCFRLSGKTLAVQMSVGVASPLNGATTVKIGLPAGNVLAAAAVMACGSPGGQICNSWGNVNDTSLVFFINGGLLAGGNYTLSGTVLIR